MSELSSRQAVRLRRAMFRIRLLIGSMAAGTSALAVSGVAVLAFDHRLAAPDRLVLAGLAGIMAYQLWRIGWATLLRRYPGLVMNLALMGEPDPRGRR